jgi:hypothetical protein
MMIAHQTIVTLTEHGRAMEQQAATIPDCMAAALTAKGLDAERYAAVNPTLDHLTEVLSR